MLFKKKLKLFPTPKEAINKNYFLGDPRLNEYIEEVTPEIHKYVGLGYLTLKCPPEDLRASVLRYLAQSGWEYCGACDGGTRLQFSPRPPILIRILRYHSRLVGPTMCLVNLILLISCGLLTQSFWSFCLFLFNFLGFLFGLIYAAVGEWE